MTETVESGDLLSLTADIVAAHVSNNNVAATEIPGLVIEVHRALAALGKPAVAAAEPEKAPAVPVRASIKPDYIVCLEDGKKLKMLKRHLMAHYQMTPEQYRARWKLPADYPMVAPNYADRRRQLAHQIGLGRKPASPPSAGDAAKPPKATRAPRKTLSVAVPRD